MLEVFLLSVIIVIIVDLSGFTDVWKTFLKKKLTGGRMSSPDYSLRPFDCSFCLTFWGGIICCIIMHKFCLWMICYTLLVAFATPLIKDVLLLIRDFFQQVIYEIRNYFGI